MALRLSTTGAILVRGVDAILVLVVLAWSWPTTKRFAEVAVRVNDCNVIP